ncbi:MAG: hypothetical protein CHACPFDD_01335 [Phycisphaerae bacterium]|nr:hypothetical protein [Phycisphaerae bacterium]
MKRIIRNVSVLAMAAACLAACGCTPVKQGFREGVSDGFSAALAALIETPVTAAVEAWVAANAD